MLILGQSWLLSILSALIAVLAYYFSHTRKSINPPQDSAASMVACPPPSSNMYIGVFILVAILVYGSFAIADSVGACRFVDAQSDILTGGAAPF